MLPAIKFKDATINLFGMQPQLVLALLVTAQVYEEFGYEEMVITSLNDATHSVSSKHYDGAAVDLRCSEAWGFTRIPEMVEAIKDRLGRHFDVIFEEDHLHIEYDAKRPV